MSFLVKRGKTYHLHVKVPLDLVAMFGTSVLSVSLGVHSKELARGHHRVALDQIHQAFHHIRKERITTMGAADIRRLVRNYVKAELAEFDLRQATGRSGNSGTLDDELDAMDTDLDYSRQMLAMRRHVNFMGPEVSSLLPGVSADASEYQMACYEMLKARIRLLEAHMERLTGHFSGHDEATILRDLDLLQQESSQPPAPQTQLASPAQESWQDRDLQALCQGLPSGHLVQGGCLEVGF